MSPENTPSLHSRYNPEGEAERYVSSLSLNSNARFFILIEPGLGYIAGPLKKRLPGAKILALHAVPAQAAPAQTALAQASPEKPDSEWYPGTGIALRDFLEREIPDSRAGEIQILEWRPALAVYRKAYLALVEEAAEFIKLADANARTSQAFGPRWVKNFFRNLRIVRKVLCPVPFSLPLVVTGAGPGLEDAIPLIRDEALGGRVFILAVSSSAAALDARGIKPGMVVSTDGGQWAAFHLYDYCRGNRPEGSGGALPCPLAASLTAALPSQCCSLPILPVSDGSLWQTLVLKELGIPFVVMPQRGTVSASALDLAFALTDAGIFIAGMDLANDDIRSHARPYSLDRFLDDKAGRLNPVYSQAYRRASLLKAGGSFGIYAAWFRKQLASYPGRLHALGKNNPLFSALERSPLNTAGAGKQAGRPPEIFKTINLAPSGDPSLRAWTVLKKALEDPAHSPKLSEELGALLVPGKDTVQADELIQVLYPLAGTTGRELP
ncbi:MAG: DUF115 domain-containing protein [Treponema sp.]|nr:DUF115 domain-containing protein [Treponema sp.]